VSDHLVTGERVVLDEHDACPVTAGAILLRAHDPRSDPTSGQDKTVRDPVLAAVGVALVA
jgi:hypothetical protein